MELHIQQRELTGNHNKKLRREGLIPAVIYSKDSSNGNESVKNIQVDAIQFTKLFKEVGQTNIIELQDGKSKTSVLVYEIQSHPVTGDIIHIGFYKPNLKEKVKAHVPVVFINEHENRLIKSNIALLSPVLSEIEVECLPTDIPNNFEIDVMVLDDVEAAISVADLKKNISSKVEILTNEDALIVKLAARRQSKDDESESTGDDQSSTESAVSA